MTTTDESVNEFSELAEALGNDPAAAERAVAGAVAGSDSTPPPDLEAPTDGPVRLPGGFRRFSGPSGDFEEVTHAVVRELNGEDEERIAKARAKGSATVMVTAILEGGVERLGNRAPREGELEDLLIGDRDFLLQEISRATFGDALEVEDFICPICSESLTVTLSKSEDIEVARLDSISDASFEVELSKGVRAKVHLPSGRDVLPLESADSGAAATTLLLNRVVDLFTLEDGTEVVPSDEPEFSKKLGIRDRRKIQDEIAKRAPGPRYNEVTFTHEPGCGNEVALSVTLMELFRGL